MNHGVDFRVCGGTISPGIFLSVHSCQPGQPEFLDKESKFPGFYNTSLDIDISHNKMINSRKNTPYVNISVAVL